MNKPTARVDALDLTLFDHISSQTSPGDRLSLLVAQSAVARKHGSYAYLEIGSHLGGSIQPHLVDERCTKIYSIDPRPIEQPNDRSPGFVDRYEGNSTARMLRMLAEIGAGDVGKIECFDSDAAHVDLAKVVEKPQLLFIDGEHTKSAVCSDFAFCRRVMADDAVVLFHDFYIIYPAIIEICRDLKACGRPHLPLRLEGEVFAIFLDPEIIAAAPRLTAIYQKNKRFWRTFFLQLWLRRTLPTPAVNFLRKSRDVLRRLFPASLARSTWARSQSSHRSSCRSPKGSD